MWGEVGGEKKERGTRAANIDSNCGALREIGRTKGGVVLIKKLIGRRTFEEGQFLDDIISWVTCSQVMDIDRVLSHYILKSGKKSKKELYARMVRDQIKEACVLEGLPTKYFLSHSLRKAAATHMRALGVSDMTDRECYPSRFSVMRYLYDYSLGRHGPLSSNELNGGVCSYVQNILRSIPPARSTDFGHRPGGRVKVISNLDLLVG